MSVILRSFPYVLHKKSHEYTTTHNTLSKIKAVFVQKQLL